MAGLLFFKKKIFFFFFFVSPAFGLFVGLDGESGQVNPVSLAINTAGTSDTSVIEKRQWADKKPEAKEERKESQAPPA